MSFLKKIFLKDFLMWAILKVFTEFVTVLLLFYVLVSWPRGMWNLSFPTNLSFPYTGRSPWMPLGGIVLPSTQHEVLLAFLAAPKSHYSIHIPSE